MSVMAFFSVGPLEIAVLAVIALLVLGPQKLPEAARSVGKGMREMREAMSGVRFDDEDEADDGRRTRTTKRPRGRERRRPRRRGRDRGARRGAGPLLLRAGYQKLADSIVSSSSSMGLV